MNEQPETDQEAYQEIVKTVRERDGKINALEKKVTQLEEAIKKNAEETSKTIVGWCQECKHPVTAEDIKQPTCPYCGAAKTYRPINPPDE